MEAARELNRTVWRLDWFARGLLDDSDREGWLVGLHSYHRAVVGQLRVSARTALLTPALARHR